MAPFDSPIGPGGPLAPPIEPLLVHKVDKLDKKQMKALGEKERREMKEQERAKKQQVKEKKREMAKAQDSPSKPMSETVSDTSRLVPSKAASLLGLADVPPTPRRTLSETPSVTPVDGSAPPPPLLRQRTQGITPVSISNKAADLLGLPTPPRSSSLRKATSFDDPFVASNPSPLSSATSHLSSVDMDREALTGGSTPSDSETSSSSSAPEASGDSALDQPAAISAKVAERFGVPYAVVTSAAAAEKRRTMGVLASVQSPGILVWPDRYIAMSPAELEMHACKHVQDLLSSRHAMREYTTGKFEGKQLVADEEFDEAMWDYEW